MRRWLSFGLLALLTLSGCKPAAVLQKGDVVRPELRIAPDDRWTVGDRVAMGILVQVHRQGQSEIGFLREEDVVDGTAQMRAKVTFLKDGAPLGEPLELPFVRDC